MKTPIQELIEHFTDAWSSPSDLWRPSKVIAKIETMLEKEYNFIEQVYYDARDNEYEHHFLINKKVPLDFSEYLKQKQDG